MNPTLTEKIEAMAERHERTHDFSDCSDRASTMVDEIDAACTGSFKAGAEAVLTLLKEMHIECLQVAKAYDETLGIYDSKAMRPLIQKLEELSALERGET